MIKANEARERVQALLNSDEQKKALAVKEFCDTTCTKAIEEAVENRKCCTEVSVPKDISVRRTAMVLRENGYRVTVTTGNTTIYISWEG